MRPGQNNNKRMRGRPTNNRRGPNPLTRSYESNGPDVKIRGNAHHVAEKYLQLARDAHTSGDPVAAENYLQHAEHYYRLIASAQAAQAAAQNGGQRPDGEIDYGEDDDEGGPLSDRFASPAERAPPPYVPPPQPFTPPHNGGQQPQPAYAYGERQPGFEGERQGQPDRPPYPPRQDRQHNRNQQDRPFRQDRNQDGRNQGENRQRDFRPYRDPNFQRDNSQPRDAVLPPPPAAPQPIIEPETPAVAALPSFITTAPRIPAPMDSNEPQPVLAEPAFDAAGAQPVADAEGRFPPRGRRRRLRSPYGFNAAGQEEGAEPTPPSDPAEAPASE